MDVMAMILPMLVNQPKVKSVIEQVFHQPAEHVIGTFDKFLDEVSKGPGIKNTAAEQQAMFTRYYEGGLAMGFTDWESEIAAAALAGYTPMDICLSFRNSRGWKETTVEKVQHLSDIIAPRFIEKGKETGLIPKDVESEQSIPKTEVTTRGGVPPWEQEGYQSNATDSSK